MIFFESTVNSDNTITFKAVENDKSYGNCILDLNGKKAVLYRISYDSEKPYIAEGLIKAAFNYAALKNYYIGECVCENIDSLLLRLGFKKTENTYVSDIPSILMGTCCKK